MSAEYIFSLISLLPLRMCRYFINLAPYVLLGTLLGEALKFTSWTRLIYRFLRGRSFLGIILASLLGIASPLCTYGTVPVLITLYDCGVAPSLLCSFLCASSMMNPQLFIMTGGGLGWEMALARLLHTFLFSTLIGCAATLIPERYLICKKLTEEQRLESETLVENRVKPKFELKAFLAASGKSLLFMGRMLLLGILIASIVDLLPLNLLLDKVDLGSPAAVIFAALLGIPIYACGGGTIPMVASLMAKGLSKGSSLAFLLTGPMTRITSLAAIAIVFRKRFLALTVAAILLYSVGVGLLWR